jgi:signal peptidase I
MFKRKKQQSGIWFHVLDVLFNVIIIVTIVAGIRTFLISPFQVEGNSMAATLEDNEYIIINKIAYILGDPERGDVVVFRPPNDNSKYYVKRVIGMPGDTVTIKNGYVFVKPTDADKAIRIEEDAYVEPHNLGHTYDHPPGSGNTRQKEFSVPDAHYFLLGDNRQGSLDSRSFFIDSEPTPYVRREAITGRVWFIALPITKIHALYAPQYGVD